MREREREREKERERERDNSIDKSRYISELVDDKLEYICLHVYIVHVHQFVHYVYRNQILNSLEFFKF